MSRVSSLCVLCIVLLGLQSMISAAVFDCCYTYTKKPLSVRAIKGYITQNSTEVCDIDAFILITKKFRVCANPKAKWVKRIIKALKKKAKAEKSAKNNTVIPKSEAI
ncbi:C-C motif chemokine 20-like [Pseudophryne corroboree]|uniref:C-C motif chemokine 20-like n=1 Tax=Pseudophryne corroboree TaxID=495146 RepID=UPI00308215B1